MSRNTAALLSSLFLLLSLGLLYAAAREDGMLRFSADSGFYDEPFYLEITAPLGSRIYYTTDGSTPTSSSIRYVEPIYIDDASCHDNVYASIPSIYSPDFLGEHPELSPTVSIPDDPVDKCTVIRACYVDAWGRLSEVSTQSYFVGYQNRNGYDSINVISIVTDPENLFDEEKGIYVIGDDDAWDANYLGRGSAWERPASVQIYGADRKPLLAQDCGLRIHGGMSRHAAQKSLRLIADPAYGADDRFDVDFWGTGYRPDAMYLFSGGQDLVSISRDYLISNAVRERDVATMHFTPCALFLDGEYWGFYWLTERYDPDYLHHYYDIEANDVYLVKNNVLDTGNEINTYNDLISFMEEMDLADPNNYAWIEQQVDMQSLIDFYAIESYIGNGDIRQKLDKGGNFAMWRTIYRERSPYGDQKWRWMLFDVNQALDSPSSDTVSALLDRAPLFYHLCQNKAFLADYVSTCMDLMNSCFAPDSFLDAISDYRQTYAAPIIHNISRYYNGSPGVDFEQSMAQIEDFITQRPEYMIRMLTEDFSLSGLLTDLHLSTNDNSMGSITVNTIEITDTSWSGTYFQDFSIHLCATPREGYRFLGWSGDYATDDPSLDIIPSTEALTLTALFAPE